MLGDDVAAGGLHRGAQDCLSSKVLVSPDGRRTAAFLEEGVLVLTSVTAATGLLIKKTIVAPHWRSELVWFLKVGSPDARVVEACPEAPRVLVGGRGCGQMV